MIVRLSRNYINLLLEEARRKYPIEACGVLFGSISGDEIRVKEIVPLRNVLKSEAMFQIDPEEFLRVLVEYEGKGLQHIGFFHSHPRYASPSIIDLKYMGLWPESIWIIVSHLESRITAYRIINGRIEEVSISIE
ncbi:M67 family metallopeptidase [Candidatus Bathyarchaeota archaeon]|nr:M67 family metallopeptidase [Candidatus Bathyarchaeota archaeon]